MKPISTPIKPIQRVASTPQTCAATPADNASPHPMTPKPQTSSVGKPNTTFLKKFQISKPESSARNLNFGMTDTIEPIKIQPRQIAREQTSDEQEGEELMSDGKSYIEDILFFDFDRPEKLRFEDFTPLNSIVCSNNMPLDFSKPCDDGFSPLGDEVAPLSMQY